MSSEWWHPIKNSDDELDWLCDHLGDASEAMIKMWERLCELDPDLPKEGWPREEYSDG